MILGWIVWLLQSSFGFAAIIDVTDTNTSERTKNNVLNLRNFFIRVNVGLGKYKQFFEFIE